MQSEIIKRYIIKPLTFLRTTAKECNLSVLLGVLVILKVWGRSYMEGGIAEVESILSKRGRGKWSEPIDLTGTERACMEEIAQMLEIDMGELIEDTPVYRPGMGRLGELPDRIVKVLKKTLETDQTMLEESREARKAYHERFLQHNMLHLKPELFEEKLWTLVDDGQKPKVPERWSNFSHERQVSIIAKINSIDISEENEARREEAPYFRAQCLANIHVWGVNDVENPPRIKGAIMKIELKDPTLPPVNIRRKRPTWLEHAFLRAKTGVMQRVGQLEESKSAWCSPVLLVPYPDRIQAFITQWGEEAPRAMMQEEQWDVVKTFFRLTGDFRELNRRTVLSIYPMPRIDALLDRTVGCDRYSSMDIEDAFFCIELHKDSRPYTAFSTPDKHLQYTCMPMGTTNSATVFAKVAKEKFEKVPEESKIVYQDDLTNIQKTFICHLINQQLIYDCCAESDIIFKCTKTHLNFLMMKTLGHLLSSEGRMVDPSLVVAIREKVAPSTLAEVQSILGLVQVAREYVPGLARIIAPIQELARKGVDVKREWGARQETSFQKIKRILTTSPHLRLADYKKPFIVRVDAARRGKGIGAVLGQVQEDGAFHPVAYWSRSITSAERNYGATELECLGMHDAILHWRTYLLNGIEFEVVTDHYALVFMVTKIGGDTNGRLQRMCLDIQHFTFRVTHRKGKAHIDADTISRLLGRDDNPHIRSEDELRDDIGPLTAEEQELLRSRFYDDADLLIKTINERRAEEQTESREKEQTRANIVTQIMTEITAIPTSSNSSEPLEDIENARISTQITTRISYKQMLTMEYCGTKLVANTSNKTISFKPGTPANRYGQIRVKELPNWVLQQLSDNHTELSTPARQELQRRINSVKEVSTSKLKEWITSDEKKLDASVELDRRLDRKRNEARVRTTLLEKSAGQQDDELDEEEEAEEEDEPETHDHDPVNNSTTTYPIITGRTKRSTAGKRITMSYEEEEARRMELADTKIEDYDYLVMQHYVNPQTLTLYQVFTVFTKKQGRLRVPTSLAYPIDIETLSVIDNNAVEEREILLAETGTKALVERLESGQMMGNDIKWPTNNQEWLAEQLKDEALEKILQQLTNPGSEKALNDGIQGRLHRLETNEQALGPLVRSFYRVKALAHGRISQEITEKFTQIMVPKHLQQRTLYQFHECMGHPGKNRMTNTLLLTYYWIHIRADIAAYTNKCHYCLRRKAYHHRAKVPIQAYPPPEYPFQRMHWDLTGPFPTTKNNNKYIGVGKCALTKAVILIPLEGKDNTNIQKCIKQFWIPWIGYPSVLVTDRGTESDNKTFKAVAKFWGCRLVTLTPRNPRANGQAEEEMLTIKNMLQYYINARHDNWDEQLGHIQYFYNSTVNEATGYTPFFLWHGYEVQSPTEQHCVNYKSTDLAVTAYSDSMQLLWHYIGVSNSEITETYNRQPAKKLEFKPYTAGDFFYYRTIPRRFFKDLKEKKKVKLSSKLQFRFSGPYIIQKVISPVLYEANIHNTVKRVHAINMKPAIRKVNTLDGAKILHKKRFKSNNVDLSKNNNANVEKSSSSGT
jgi:hypothetical protein